MVFVDSNIWCYYFDQSANEHESVSKKLDNVIESSQDIHINTVVLMEVGHFLIKNLGGVKGKEKLDQMLEYSFKMSELSYPTTVDSLEILSEEHHTGIGGRDSTILASMNEKGVEKLITHDQAFKRIEEIEVIDPVG